MTNDLQTLISERLAALGERGRPLSFRAAAARGGLSHTTVSRIAQGAHHGTLSEETIRGLALALDLPPTQIEKAAGIYRGRPAEPFVLPPRASRLTRREREVVVNMVDALLAADERGRATAAQPANQAQGAHDSLGPADASPEQQRFGLVADGTVTGRVSRRDTAAYLKYLAERDAQQENLSGE